MELESLLEKAINEIKRLRKENASLRQNDDRATIKALMSENEALQQKLNHYEMLYEEKQEKTTNIEINAAEMKEWLNKSLIEINGVTYVTLSKEFPIETNRKYLNYFLNLKISGIPIFEKTDSTHTVCNYSIAQIYSFVVK